MTLREAIASGEDIMFDDVLICGDFPGIPLPPVPPGFRELTHVPEEYLDKPIEEFVQAVQLGMLKVQ